MKRSKEEVAEMVKALRHERTTVPEQNAFGDNNHALIDEQIAILEGTSDWDLSTEEAEEEFGEQGLSTLQLTEDWAGGAACDAPASEEAIEAVRAQAANTGN